MGRRQSQVPGGASFSRVGAILVSHGHFDHIADAASLAKQFHAKVVDIYEVCQFLKARGVEAIAPMKKAAPIRSVRLRSR